MTIEEAMVAAFMGSATIGALAGDRIYPLTIPQDVALPAAAYQRISGPRTLAHDGPSGLAFARFQVTCTAATYAAAKTLAQAFRVLVDGYRGTMGGVGGVTVHQVGIENEVDGYSQTDKLSTVRMDIVILYTE